MIPTLNELDAMREELLRAEAIDPVRLWRAEDSVRLLLKRLRTAAGLSADGVVRRGSMRARRSGDLA